MNNFDICIGIITAVYGVKGYVRICSFAENPEDFMSFSRVFDRDMMEYKLQIISSRNNKIIAAIEGVNSRAQAEKLCNKQLFIKRSELPVTEQDQFYHADLCGMTAKLTSGESIGIVKNVFNFGAGDLLEICDITSERTLYHPFTRVFVPEVNLEGRYLVLKSVDEVIE